MNEEDPLQKVLDSLLSDYFTTYHISVPMIPTYRFSNPIADEYLSLRPRALEEQQMTYAELNSFNGFMIPPRNMDGQFIVLINAQKMADDIENGKTDWIGTIIHETTHAQDYWEYAKLFSIKDYSTAEHDRMFWLWTEIHARSCGYYFVRKYVFLENMLDRAQIPDIMEREIPGQQQMLFEKYHAINDGNQQAYLVAQYLGRLYTLQQLFPQDFTDAWIQTHFSGNKWMSDWYFFFQRYPVLSKAAEHFVEMRKILKENFLWF